MNRSRLRRVPTALAAGLAATALAAVPAAAAPAPQRVLGGTVASGGTTVLARVPVSLYRAAATATGAPRRLAHATTDAHGRFTLRYRRPAGAVLYLLAGARGRVRLAATLGASAPRHVTVNELTTAATGYALAQFTTGGWRIGGPAPGPQNAALMAANLADPATGRISRVLLSPPNGRRTSTLATFRSVANMLAPCARSPRACGPLLRAAHVPGRARPTGALQAVADIARAPWHAVGPLFTLSRSGPAPYPRALSQAPAAWTMPLRFAGDGRSIDGPGNVAIDGDGNLYIANNYAYGRNPRTPVCGSDLLPVLGPDGRALPGTPFQGGGLSGAGYGITFDPSGRVWVGNFGFAAPVPKCPQDRQPPHNSVSVFDKSGTSLAGDTGVAAGGVSWPQGTVSDRSGTIWVANCGNSTVTRMPGDAPGTAVGLNVGLNQPFDIATDANGRVFVTGVGNSKLAILNPDGSQRALLDADQLGLNRPMGIAADSRGDMWIANSGFVSLPCPDANFDLRDRGGSLSLVTAGGRPLTHAGTAFTGGGLTAPWGIAVDGDDNVWVSNFSHQRISQFCGVRRRGCRPGGRAGDPISPDGSGYAFDGLTRSTSVEIDPSGNVWATNNWKQAPVQTNPGGLQMVAFVGAAAPLRTPLIGPPVPLMR